MSIVIDDKEFTVLSKENWKKDVYLFKVRGPLGEFTIYGSMSDCNTPKLYALYTPMGGNIFKRTDSYVYGHNIHYKLATFINSHIQKIPEDSSELRVILMHIMMTPEENRKPRDSKFFDVFMNENKPKHHILYDVFQKNVSTSKETSDPVLEVNPIYQHLFNVVSSLFTHINNNYERLSLICSFYLNLFTVSTDLVNIECLPIGKNEMIFDCRNRQNDKCSIHITPYEYCIYQNNFSRPTRQHADYVCSQYGIDPINLTDEVLQIIPFDDYPSVYTITQSYTYVIHNHTTGVVTPNPDIIEIPHMVVEDFTINELGTYENFILCGGYISKLFDYGKQLINPTEYDTGAYGFIVPYISKMWNPLQLRQ